MKTRLDHGLDKKRSSVMDNLIWTFVGVAFGLLLAVVIIEFAF